VVTATIDTNSITQGAISNDNIVFTMDYQNAFEAITNGSSEKTTSIGSNDVGGNTMMIRKAKPTIAIVALPTTKLTAGVNAIFKFKVAADTSDVGLKAFNFTVAKDATVALSSYQLKDSDNNIIDLDFNGDGTAELTSAASMLTFLNEQTISAGSDKTYTLYASAAGVNDTADYVSTKLAATSVSTVKGTMLWSAGNTQWELNAAAVA
jgi:hypothetical protein